MGDYWSWDNYLYFGAAKDLPGVKELFIESEPKKFIESPEIIELWLNDFYYGTNCPPI